MKKLIFAMLVMVLLFLSSCSQQPEWKPLFDGKTFDGWRGLNRTAIPDSGWVIEDGMIKCNGVPGSGDIITEKEYGQFEFKFEWKMITKGGNSGIKYFVVEELSTGHGGIGLEFQLLDDLNHPMMQEGTMKPNDFHTTGALYELYAPSEDKVLHHYGEWNTGKIVSKGNHLEHWLNGKLVMECERGSDDFQARVAKSKFNKYPDYALSETGHILIQNHSSQTVLRNLYIRELK